MGTLVVGSVLAACIGFASYSVYKNHKKGSCSCGCSGCSQKDRCH